MVGGHLVEPGPAAGDRRLEQHGRAPLEDRRRALEPFVLGLAHVARAEEEAGALAVEVEAGLEVDRHRDVLGQVLERARVGDAPSLRRDRQVNARHGPDLSRPDTGGADNRGRVHAARLPADPPHLAGLAFDGRHRAAPADARAVSPRARGVALDRRVGCGDSGSRAERRRLDALQSGKRREPPRLLRGEHPARQPERVLHRHVALEPAHVLGPRQQEQVADLLEVHLPAGPLAEPPPGIEVPQAHPHVQLVGEHRAHAARPLAGRARAELGALEQQHVHARLREVEGDAGADDASPDDHDLGPFHARLG